MLGFGLIILAALILSGYNKKTEGSRGWVGILLLLFATLGDGLTGFCQQLYRQYYTEGGSLTTDVVYPKSIYHFYTYVFAVIVLALFLTVYAMYCRFKKCHSASAKYHFEIQAF